MALVVTGVGFLIHVYSVGYMHGDRGFARYFAYLNLFTTAMLILVLADNLPLLFVGWEGVGLCSYLLIGFWYEKTENAAAGKKAFLGNRIGGAGFRHRADRHQARARLLDRQPARLHVPRPRRRRDGRRHLPPGDARLLQGAALPGRRECDPRPRRRAGHAPHGGSPDAPAGHVLDDDRGRAGHRRRAAALGLLQQGRDLIQRVRWRERAAHPRRRRPRRGGAHRLLHGAARLPDLPRGIARVARGRAPPPRIAAGDDRAPRRAGGRRRRRGLAPRAGAPRSHARRRPTPRAHGARHRARCRRPLARVPALRRPPRRPRSDRGAPRRLLWARARQVPRRRALRRARRPAAVRGRRPRGARHRPEAHRRCRERHGRARGRDERALAPGPDRQRPALRALLPDRRPPAARVLRRALMATVPLLTLLVFAPLVGAVLLALLPREPLAGVRRAALVFSLVPFALSLWMLGRFRPGEAEFQLVERAAWIPAWGIEYRLGVDGVSLFLVLLTAFLTPLVVLASWGDIHRRVKEFFALLLVLETGMLGTFLALDLFLFYVFWEVMLVPMAFLIGVWGGPQRVYAAIKFVLYTMAGSLLMLVGILYLAWQVKVQTGAFAFGYERFLALHLGAREQLYLFAAFALAFAIKVPL